MPVDDPAAAVPVDDVVAVDVPVPAPEEDPADAGVATTSVTGGADAPARAGMLTTCPTRIGASTGTPLAAASAAGERPLTAAICDRLSPATTWCSGWAWAAGAATAARAHAQHSTTARRGNALGDTRASFGWGMTGPVGSPARRPGPQPGGPRCT